MPDHQFNATTVWVRDPPAGLWDPNRMVGGVPVGGYVPLVMQHLNNILATPTGTNFFPALTTLGKRQVVCYHGENVANENAAFGPQAAANKVIRAAFGEGDYVATGTALNVAVTAAVAANALHNTAWIATQLLTTPLHRWNPTHTGAGSPLNPGNLLVGTPAFNGLRDLMAANVTRWCNGTLQLRDDTTMDLLVLILEPHLANGRGGASRINYNPLKATVGGVARRPECGLFHELVHAYYSAEGSQLSQEDSTTERVGRYFELMAVGLGPFAVRPYHENAMRGHFGDLLRTQY